MRHIITTRFSKEPPPGPLNLNGVIFDFWKNAETGKFKHWDGQKWVEVKMKIENSQRKQDEG